MSGQVGAGGGDDSVADDAASESASQKLRAELTLRSMMLQKGGVSRYCACDPSTETVITTLYDTGESSLGAGNEMQIAGEDIDCTLGTSACNDVVIVRNHERYHSEAAAPAIFTFFQEDGTPIRYVYDFVFQAPTGDKMVPLDQLGRNFSSLWLLGKLKLVATVHDAEQFKSWMNQSSPGSTSNECSRLRLQRKHKAVCVKVKIVDFFVDHGWEPTDIPAIYAVSEHDIYYRLDKAASRYTTNFTSFLLLYDLSTRVAKTFQEDRNRRLASILADVTSADRSALTTWGEPMHLPGISASEASSIIEIIYSECLYQHLFHHPSNYLFGDLDFMNDAEVQKPEGFAQNDMKLMDNPVEYGDIEKDAYSLGDDAINGNIHAMNDFRDPNSYDERGNSPMGVDDSKYKQIGTLLYDILKAMREHRPLFFFDEGFVLPDYLKCANLAEKYEDAFVLPPPSAEDAMQNCAWTMDSMGDGQNAMPPNGWTTHPNGSRGGKSAKTQKSRQTNKPHKSSKAANVVGVETALPPPGPIEIKSKVSGRIIKRNSKLTDVPDRVRSAVDESALSAKRACTGPAVDEALQRKQQMLVETERMCNGLALPDDFEYSSYNTTSELSGDETSHEPIALLNDCHVDLKDARYYSRDIPLRTLRFYGADDILDIATVCRQFSANPSGLDPLLPRFSFNELERCLLYTTSVDTFKPLEPSTFIFKTPQCLCNFFGKYTDWFSKLGETKQKMDDLYLGLMRCLVEYSRVDSFEYRLKIIRDACDLTGRKRDVQEREIKAGQPDTETLLYFLATHGGCLYRGRYRNVPPESDVQIPYINSVRWNKRFKRVERLLAASKSHKYTPIGFEYMPDGIMVTVDSRLEGVPLDVLMNGRHHGQGYRVVYPSNVFEVLPTYSKKFQVWQAEAVPEVREPSGVIEKLNSRLSDLSLSVFAVERLPQVGAHPVMGSGFREPFNLLNVDTVMRPEMLTVFNWSCILRIYLFYAFYTCRHKYMFKLNSVVWGEAPSAAMTSMDDDDDEEDEYQVDKPEKGSFKPTPSGGDEEEEEEEDEEGEEEENEGEEVDGEGDEAARVGRRRGWGVNRYSPYYEFEIDWYPDMERVSHLFQGSISPEAVKVVMEKLRVASFFELEIKDRLTLLRWLGELLTYQPYSKRFIDQRNDEFFLLKTSLTKNESSQASNVATTAEGQSETTEKSAEDEKAVPSNGEVALVKSEQEDNAASSTEQELKTVDNTSDHMDIDLKTEPEDNVKGELASDPEGTDTAGVDAMAVDLKIEPSENLVATAKASVEVKSELVSKNSDDAMSVDPAASNGHSSQSAMNADGTKRKKPKEIMRDLAELEERYLQRNVHLGRDRFYNDYYYFGPELGCRIYVRTLPAARFTAQRASLRTKLLRNPSFGSERFRFDITKYAKRLEEDRIFGSESKRGRYKRAGAKKSDTESQEVEPQLPKKERATPETAVDVNDPNAMLVSKEELAMQLVKRKKQKGRRPRMIKPRLRRSREFFDRHPTKFDTVQEYLNYLVSVPPRLCWAVIDNPRKIRMFIDRLSTMTTNERALQAKLMQLEPELKALYNMKLQDEECWRAPTTYGQLLTSFACGVQSYSSTIRNMVNSSIIRYSLLAGSSPNSTVDAVTTKEADQDLSNSSSDVVMTDGAQPDTVSSSNVKTSLSDIVSWNDRLLQFIENSSQRALTGCCGDLSTVASAVMSMIELVLLCESLVSNYCDWLHWTSLRSEWQGHIDALYLEVQTLNPAASNTASTTVIPEKCECTVRNGTVALSAQEKLLLHVIEELGLWYQYVHVSHQDRIELFTRYRMNFISLKDIEQPTLLCDYLSHLEQGSLVYMFGGYKEWLLSLSENTTFPRDLLIEMIREYGNANLNAGEAALLRALPTMDPLVPTETLEAYVESAWFFEVPGYGRLARLALRSVGYGEYDAEKHESIVTATEGLFVPYLQNVVASLAAHDRTRQNKRSPDDVEYVLRGTSHESQRFIVYAPLDTIERESEFLLPLPFMAENMQQIWRQSMRCTWNGRQAHVRRMSYAAADLWRVMQVDAGGNREMVNLWEVSSVQTSVNGN
ncbi:uncharacterized protein BXIN_2156 [Babesia sp. Xinjiang]|uniref:uncharacterized protein n=1 Tax=Babesia sp. Xinjiang TaxID=462227 RepID=UPI000A24FACB|nr:uncharacterized protein BXIN_2156 [Babesia sp. Xinjiang]ORM40477.1 hypothetical protein BXIN_2156 [Babesia sp. Xinjiang]